MQISLSALECSFSCNLDDLLVAPFSPVQTSCPDPLGDMAEMCKEMYMDGCDVYLGWCRHALTWQAAGHGSMSYYCPGTEPYGAGAASSMPPTLMFLHQRVREVLLFRPWLPTTTGEGWRGVVGATMSS